MSIPTEVAQQMDGRIQELEKLLSRAHGFIAVGPASEIAKRRFLDEIATALNWEKIDTEAMLKHLEDYANS